MIERVRPALDDDVAELVRLGVLVATGVRNDVPAPALDARMSEREAAIREDWRGRTAGAIPELRAARTLYRAAGLDPTRTRPSNEALVRRVLRGDPLPRINPAVDACNLSAVTYHLPIGLHDIATLKPPLRARLGTEGEWYEGLGKPKVNLGGRFCLADADGPFGNPSSDSKRASVATGTTSVLWVVYAPADYAADALREHLAWTDRLLEATGLVSDGVTTDLVEGP